VEILFVFFQKQKDWNVPKRREQENGGLKKPEPFASNFKKNKKSPDFHRDLIYMLEKY